MLTLCVAVAAGQGLTERGLRTLPTALYDIRHAFLANDATRLATVFPPRGPVFVAMPPFQPAAFLAPGPLKAFLDRLVRARVTTGFELMARLPDTPRESSSVFVKVKWTHRSAASATLQVDYLHLALRYAAEDADWQIVEIKTSLR